MKVLFLMVFLVVAPLSYALDWEFVAELPEFSNPIVMDADPAHGRILLGTSVGYRTYDIDTDEWIVQEETDPWIRENYKVLCFAADPDDPLALLTGREDMEWYGYIVDNYGLTFFGPILWAGWDTPPDMGMWGAVMALERDPTRTGTLYWCNFGWSGGCIFRTTDDLASWEIVHQIPEHSNGMAIAVASNGDILVGHGITGYPYEAHGLLRSSDGGDSWEDISGGLPLPAPVGGIEIDPAAPQHFYVRQGGVWEPQDPALGIYETRDGGQHWDQLLSKNVYDFAMHPENPALLVASVFEFGSPIFLTIDGGLHWVDVSDYYNWSGGAKKIAISTTDDRVYVAGDTDGIWRADLALTAVGNTRPSIQKLTVYPNPFNSNVALGFALETRMRVQVMVHDIGGHEVIRLLEGEFGPGLTELNWDGQNNKGRAVASGVYLISIVGEGYRETQRAILLK